MLQVFDKNFRPAFQLGPSSENHILNYLTYANKLPEKLKGLRSGEYHIGLSSNGIEDYTKDKDKGEFNQHMVCIDLDITDSKHTIFDVTLDDGALLERLEQAVCVDLVGDVYDKDIFTFVRTGRGYHVWIMFDKSLTEAELKAFKRFVFFTASGVVNTKVKFQVGGVEFKVDPASFNPRRISRLPVTWYGKTGVKPHTTKLLKLATKQARTGILDKLQTNLKQADIEIGVREKIYNNNFDFSGVLKGCSFLTHCRTEQNSVTEPQWNAMISIIKSSGNNQDDISFQVHEHSKDHKSYDRKTTEEKINRNKLFSPNCDSVDMLWGKCNTCPHYGVVKNPSQIKSEDYIPTRHTGFRVLRQTKTGPVPGAVSYVDLVKHYKTLNKFVNADYKNHYTYNSSLGIWELQDHVVLKKFCNDSVRPEPLEAQRKEFAQRLLLENYIKGADFGINNYIALNNGVLDVREDKFIDFAPELEVTTKLDFNYTPGAECPKFIKFLDTLTAGSDNNFNLIKRFMGYLLLKNCTDQHKALVLMGTGGNGKSTLVKILSEMVGSTNTTSIPIRLADNPTYGLALHNKLLYILPEATGNLLSSRSSIIKSLISGDTQTARVLYSHAFNYTPVCKVVIDTNHTLNVDGDFSNALMRRLLVVKTGEAVSHKDVDVNILDKLKTEMSGILNFSIEGLKDLQKYGEFLPEKARVNTNEDIMYAGDPIYDFFKNHMEKTTSRYTPDVSVVFSSFLTYCDSFNIETRQYNRNSFLRTAKRVCKRLYGVTKTQAGELMGVKLKNKKVATDNPGSAYDDEVYLIE